MRLPRPFYRLPVRFDVERLEQEVRALPESAWAPHPNGIAGNTSVRLISVGGAENDDVNGVMRATSHLQASPYLRQVLASFGVVWSRSRLLRLAPHASVPEHADINYHWFNRVRVHIPVITRPEVQFYCDGQRVHMAAGDAWVFDNWRLHKVENPTDQERIHLVADTSGTAAFWQLIAQGEIAGHEVRHVRYDRNADVQPLTEQTRLAPAMSPAEVDLLILDLRAELAAHPESPNAHARLARYNALLDAFCRDWRQLYALHGDSREGWPELVRLRDHLRAASRSAAEGLVTRTNRVAAHAVLEGRVLRAMISLPSEFTASAMPLGTKPRPARELLKRPVFIVAAPRSGSTLLFETLAVSRSLRTLGGEAHWLVEGLAELQPGAPGVESNRLEAAHATDAIADRIVAQILERLAVSEDPVRLLEKTPKNALRIPFFDRIFPDAQFVFLWRDPRENLSSIMQAWRAGRWKTYNGLPDFDGPWSLLLPPGWRALRGRPLEEIAAWQWECTNRIALDDLARLPRERWTCVRYADLVSHPRETVQRLCSFMGIAFDDALAARVDSPLPLSRHTLTPPAPDKWRRDAGAIERVLPSVTETWRRLREMTDDFDADPTGDDDSRRTVGGSVPVQQLTACETAGSGGWQQRR